MRKKLIGGALALAMALSLCAAPAFAEDTGGFTVAGGTYGTDYTYDAQTKILNILTGTPLVISGTNVEGSIQVGAGVSANLTFQDLSVKGVAYSSGPVVLASTSSLTLTLNGANSAQDSSLFAGVEVPFGASLIIKGTGSLTAAGTNTSAGIGEGPYKNGWGNITIESGTVAATGGRGGAGIGGAGGSRTKALQCGTIEIVGGAVTAQGGTLGTNGGAGIGSGSNTKASNSQFTDDAVSGGTIIIRDGDVTATGGSNAAGIGGGANGDGGNILLSGGTVKATGGTGGAGVGCGGKTAEEYNTVVGDITIADGMITAQGGTGAADIGAGALHQETQTDRVEITGGTINCGGQLNISVGNGDEAGVVLVDKGAGVPADTAVTTGYTIALNQTTAQLQTGGTVQLTVTVTPQTNYTWASSDSSVASVSAYGLVTAKKAGTADILVTLNSSGKTAKCTVTVKAKDVPPASAPDAGQSAGKQNPKTGV